MARSADTRWINDGGPVACSFREQTRTPANDELVLLAGLQR
jgi:hypothetical protein